MVNCALWRYHRYRYWRALLHTHTEKRVHEQARVTVWYPLQYFNVMALTTPRVASLKLQHRVSNGEGLPMKRIFRFTNSNVLRLSILHYTGSRVVISRKILQHVFLQSGRFGPDIMWAPTDHNTCHDKDVELVQKFARQPGDWKTRAYLNKSER